MIQLILNLYFFYNRM